MIAIPDRPPLLTPAEYLTWEAQQRDRHGRQ